MIWLLIKTFNYFLSPNVAIFLENRKRFRPSFNEKLSGGFILDDFDIGLYFFATVAVFSGGPAQAAGDRKTGLYEEGGTWIFNREISERFFIHIEDF